MSSDDITKDQARAIAAAINRQKAYLPAPSANGGFPAGDPPYLKVQAAYDAVFRVWIDLYHASSGMKHKRHL